MREIGSSSMQRRAFLSAASAGITIGAIAGPAEPAALSQSADNPRWQPARHTQDDWLEKIPGQHRLVFDTTEPNGLSSALLYASNFYQANQADYGLQNSDLAVVIVTRHLSTPFGYNETIWAKYGEQLSNFVDRNKEPSKTNTYARQLNGVINRGTRVAVCRMASTAIAGSIARAVGTSQDEILKEIADNLLPNAQLVPAGIVAVNRAQERGYTLVHAV
jgi:intracellular sulfur oxidation DsrE/DsrF family protein